MPSAHAYNANIARDLHGVSQKHIDLENAINDNPVPINITSQLEGTTLKNPAVVGGSGFAASTIQDLGFDGCNRRSQAEECQEEDECSYCR